MSVLIRKNHKTSIASRDIPALKIIYDSEEIDNRSCEHLEEKDGYIINGFELYEITDRVVLSSVYKIALVIIPKGAEYCYGACSKISSNKLLGCLKIDKDSKIKIAEEDIICKKVVAYTQNSDIWKGHYNYNYYGLFNKEILATDHLAIIKQDSENIVCFGFCAFLDEFSIDCRIDCNLDTVECTGVTAVIPKGAEYCIGNNNDIISNKMIVRNYNQDLSPYLFHVQSNFKIEKNSYPIKCWVIANKNINNLDKIVNLKLTGSGYLFNHLLPFPSKENPKIIKNGFKAYRKLSRKTELICKGSEDIVYFAIIPPGSEYCYGDNEDIVSNQIIVFSSEEKFEEYLKTN